jgi:hypothetical protein
MRKLMIREVETVKTTAAGYLCGCPGLPPCDIFGGIST